MNDARSPFFRRPGCDGVVVSLADKRWYLRQWHAHDTLEINLVLRGSGQVLLENRRYPLLPGHVIWLWPGQRRQTRHWLGSRPARPCCREQPGGRPASRESHDGPG